MTGIVHRPGEGESLFGGRIVIKSALSDLTLTESWFKTVGGGASPHLHHGHADSFYVFEGELAFLLHDEEHVLGPGSSVSVPPGVVHGFRNLTPARFLNFHTPDGGFAENLRARDRGEPGGFDSIDVEPGSGLPANGASLFHAGEGERFVNSHRVARILAGSDELSMIEFELEPSFGGPDPHTHTDHTDSFYVLGGTVEVQLDSERIVAGPGTFVAATPGVEHTFSSGPEGGKLLNVHAPSAGFHERFRAMA